MGRTDKWTSVGCCGSKFKCPVAIGQHSKNGERASDAPFCPAASFPSPASKTFGRRYRMRPAGRLIARFVPLQFKQEGHAGHFRYSLTVKKLHGHQLCSARPKFQPPNMAQQYVVVPSFTPPLRAGKTP